MRMAYLRKPDGMKRGSSTKENRSPITRVKTVMPDTPPAVCTLPIGEDAASQQRHLKVLQSELKKVNPNRQVVKELMKRTFPTRRKFILDGNGLTVQEILLTYPALKDPAEVCILYHFLIKLNT